ncbi:tyrosine-type recombinase/integrase [Niallia sp. 01092]|uniref:tyrosine-type recombinase/integrase n=1 Tax=unclassified Niallia TaxID=2837522 RepID=UPI003FD2B1AB
MIITLPDYIYVFMEDLQLAGRSKLTLKQYESDIKKFFVWMDKHKENTEFDTFKALRAEDIRSYFLHLHHLQLSQATIRRLASVLSRLMKFHQCIAAEEIHKLAAASPLRALNDKDFITDKEFTQLMKRMKTKDSEQQKKSARNYLLNRNIAIVLLIRTYGLTPTEIHSLTMKHINFAQKELMVQTNEQRRTFQLQESMMNYLRDYFFSIPPLFRPKYNSKDPLFVAFNNISLSFQYDYDRQRPKDLSVRAIQEMIKDEVRLANLRKISAVTLRNTSILDFLQLGYLDDVLMERFALTSEASLRRYKQYLENISENN